MSGLLRARITPSPRRKAGLFGAASAQRMLLIWVVVLAAFLSIWHFLDEGAPPRRQHAHREVATEPASTGDGAEASDVDSSP